MSIEFPIEVNNIKPDDGRAIQDPLFGGKMGDLVKIRPCAEEYQNKTYLGFLIGDASIGTQVAYNTETKELQFRHHRNPAIFVPELGKIIYGMESWWGKIKDESELSQITDEDIDNVWYYVKALKRMQKEGKKSE